MIFYIADYIHKEYLQINNLNPEPMLDLLRHQAIPLLSLYFLLKIKNSDNT